MILRQLVLVGWWHVAVIELQSLCYLCRRPLAQKGQLWNGRWQEEQSCHWHRFSSCGFPGFRMNIVLKKYENWRPLCETLALFVKLSARKALMQLSGNWRLEAISSRLYWYNYVVWSWGGGSFWTSCLGFWRGKLEVSYLLYCCLTEHIFFFYFIPDHEKSKSLFCL